MLTAGAELLPSTAEGAAVGTEGVGCTWVMIELEGAGVAGAAGGGATGAGYAEGGAETG